jgi:hypothetical protein
VLPELPPDAHALVLSMTCFSAGGFKNVKTLQVLTVWVGVCWQLPHRATHD